MPLLVLGDCELIIQYIVANYLPRDNKLRHVIKRITSLHLYFSYSNFFHIFQSNKQDENANLIINSCKFCKIDLKNYINLFLI